MAWTMRAKFLVSIILLAQLAACAATRPANTGDVCQVFEQRRSWFRAAQRAEDRWNIPVPVSMAFIDQESGFRARAKPPRKRILGFIPGRRPSNAYGYAQALDSTWEQYQRESGNRISRRSNFADAVDFVAWYNRGSVRASGIAPNDAYNLYLAYHEGNGGFQRRTYTGKTWLLDTARAVQNKATRYETQLRGCERKLGRNWLLRLLT
jgi:hypothetical protein